MNKQLEVAAIDVGFGTTCVASEITGDHCYYHCFPSRAVKVNPTELKRLESFGTTQRNTVLVNLDGSSYEVGPGVLSKAADANERLLNKRYISSPAYKALFIGGLSLLKTDCIDLLVAGLPLNQLDRKDELLNFMIGEHHVDGRVIRVKQAHVLPQPLGALTYHAKSEAKKMNCGIMEALGNRARVTVDPGYGTTDFLTSTGLTIDEERTKAFELGQGKILRSLSTYLSEVLGTSIGTELVDKAFNTKKLEIFAETYDFPVADGVFDCLPLIDSLCNEAVDLLTNMLGEASDIQEFIVSGGPAPDFARALERAFPRHTVKLVEKHEVAVCLGFAELARQIAGVNSNKVA